MKSDDLGTELAKELVGQIPIREAMLPAARSTGELLTDLIKILQLALAPVQLVAAYQDRFRNFIDRAVRRVPEERRVTPAPQIVGPIIEAIRYEPEGTPLDEMFSELMSRSIDDDRVHEAHPSYPIIIKQLSSDEARMLTQLGGQSFNYVHARNYDRKQNIFVGEYKVEVDDFPRVGLDYPHNVSFYIDHLNQLGLAGLFQEGNQEPIMGNDPLEQIGIRIRRKYALTDLGRRFVHACSALP